jgi:tetratricopeptide (TPR) repeat protein
VLAFRRAIAIDPENHVRWNAEIANTYHHHARKYDAAIAVYEELLKADSQHAEKWRWQIATAYRDAGKHKQAIGHYRQCTNFPSNYREMAMCHRRLKNYGEAIVLYGQIMGGAPKSAPWALLEIGLTQEQAGQKEKAISTFRQVCKRFPKDRHASQAHARLQSKYKITVTLGGAKDE